MRWLLAVTVMLSAEPARPTFTRCVLHSGGSERKVAQGVATSTCWFGAECIAHHGDAGPGDGFVDLTCTGADCVCALTPVFSKRPYTFRVHLPAPCGDTDAARAALLRYCLEGIEVSGVDAGVRR